MATRTATLLPIMTSNFPSLGYEIDAWGRIRRMVQSATASQQATEADLRFVRPSVAASVATYYYTLREADAETLRPKRVQLGPCCPPGAVFCSSRALPGSFPW
jgi:hypothetical protein